MVFAYKNFVHEAKARSALAAKRLLNSTVGGVNSNEEKLISVFMLLQKI